jgi:hypothetical protein
LGGFLRGRISQKENVIVGGDLNFTIKRDELWGRDAIIEPLGDNFVHKLESVELVDVNPIKLIPT